MVSLICHLLTTINNVSSPNSEVFAHVILKLSKTLAQVMHKSEARKQFSVDMYSNIKSIVALMKRHWYGAQRQERDDIITNGLKVIRIHSASEHSMQEIENEFYAPPLMSMLQDIILDNSLSINIQRESKLLIKNFKRHSND